MRGEAQNVLILLQTSRCLYNLDELFLKKVLMQVINSTVFVKKIHLPPPQILIAYSRTMFKNDKRHLSQCKLWPQTPWGTCNKKGCGFFLFWCIYFPSSFKCCQLLSSHSNCCSTYFSDYSLQLPFEITNKYCLIFATAAPHKQVHRQKRGKRENDGHAMKWVIFLLVLTVIWWLHYKDSV